MEIRKGNDAYLVVFNGFAGVCWLERYRTWHEKADFETCDAFVCDFVGAVSALRRAKRSGFYIYHGMPPQWERVNRLSVLGY